MIFGSADPKFRNPGDKWGTRSRIHGHPNRAGPWKKTTTEPGPPISSSEKGKEKLERERREEQKAMASLFAASTPPRLLHGAGRRPSASSTPAATRVELPPAGDAIKVESLVDLQLKVGDPWRRLKDPADGGGAAGELVLLRSSSSGGGGSERDEFYLNLGMAVRTLREDLPAVFSRDLNYDIYRCVRVPACRNIGFRRPLGPHPLPHLPPPWQGRHHLLRPA